MTSLFFLLTPFTYAELYGVRVVILQVVLGAIALLFSFKRKPFKTNTSLLFSIPLAIVSILYAFFSGYYESLFSFLVFSTLLFLSFQIAIHNSASLGVLKNVYVMTCLVVAIGLIVQVVAHVFFGVVLFRYVLFGGARNSYSFIWADFSFVSLFVVSCLPIVIEYKSRILILLIAIVLVAASIFTSARTGIAALFLILVIAIVWAFARSFIRLKINPKYLLLGAFSATLPLIMIYALPLATGRELTVSSSGRFDGFVLGFEFLSGSPLFGAYLDKEFFASTVTTIPHNLFLYPLIMGGTVYFILFLIFFLSLLYEIRKSDTDLKYSILICFIGFQFIPSFFSAYFFAILLGIAMASSRINLISKKEGGFIKKGVINE